MRTVIFLLLLVVSHIGYAQEFLKATITKTDGTIISADIKKTNYSGTPQKFLYRDHSGDSLAEIMSGEIAAIHFENGMVLENYFIAINVIIRKYIDRDISDYNLKKTFLHQNVLVERLIAGTYSLYLFTDKYDFDHFFIKHVSDTGIVYLRNKSYVVGKTGYHQDQLFRNQINDIVTEKGCGDFVGLESIRTLPYEMNAMVALIKDLNNCSGSQVNTDSVRNRKKVKIRVGVLGGIVSTGSTDPGTVPRRYLSQMTGGYVELIPGKMRKDYTVGIDLSINPYRQEYYGANNVDTLQIRMKYWMAKGVPMIRKFIREEGKGLFIEGGASFGVSVSGREIHYYRDTSGIVLSNTYKDTKALWGLVVGAGFDLKRISLHVRLSGLPVRRISNYYGLIAKFRVF